VSTGLAALFAACDAGACFHCVLGLFMARVRFALPPLVTGLVVTNESGLALVKVGIQSPQVGAAIGTTAYGKPD